MDFPSEKDIKDARTLTLQEHRLQIQKIEKQVQAEYNAAKQILDSDDKPTRRRKPLFKSLPKPGGLTLESKVEQEQHRMHILTNQHNRLKFALRAKEAQLMEMEQTLEALELEATPDADEHAFNQRVRQLENSLEKMTMKITEAEKIHSTYLHIHEHLQQEMQEMPVVMEQLQSAVAVGQTELGKVAKMSWSAVAAADSTTGKLVQMEREMMEEKMKMECELGELNAVKKEMEGRMEKDGDHRSSVGQHRPKEQMQKKKAEADTAPVRAQQSPLSPSTSQSSISLVEDIDTLREALGCIDLQELVKRVVSQRATREQLHIQMTQCEELVKQKTDTLADLELQHAHLKFSVGSMSFDNLKEQMEAELQQEDGRVRQLEAKLKKAQNTLDGIEQGVANLYYRMICVPVEKLPSEAATDTIDKLMYMYTQLPMLQSTVLGLKDRDSSLDREKVWSFLEQNNMMEPKNYKRTSSPVDTFQLHSHEEDCSPSRDEIKRCSIKLAEAGQPKKKSQKSAKKR